MISILYSRKFIRSYNRLDNSFKNKVKSKIKLLKNRENHGSLRVHKLHGEFTNVWSFSIDYSCRITFEYLSDKKVIMLDIGDHNIYKKRN